MANTTTTSGSSTESIQGTPSDHLHEPLTSELLQAVVVGTEAEKILPFQQKVNRSRETDNEVDNHARPPLPNNPQHVIVIDFDEDPRRNLYKKSIYRAKKSAAHTTSFLIIIHTMLIVQLFNTLPSVLKCSYFPLSLVAMCFPGALSLGKLVLINLDYLEVYAKLDGTNGLTAEELRRRDIRRKVITWSIIALLGAYAVFIACGTTGLICTLPPTHAPLMFADIWYFWSC